MLDFIEVSVGEGHGIVCTRCAGATGPIEPSYRGVTDIAADVRAAVDGWRTGAGPNVALVGPEPFADPELPAVVSAAIEAGVARLRLDTGAAALADPGVAAGALNAGVRHVRIVLLAGTPGVHDALAVSPGAFDATIAGTRTFVSVARSEQLAVSLTAVIPVCRHNVRDVAAAVGAAIDGGVSAVTLRVADGGLDMRGALPWLTAACDTGVVNGVWVELEGVPLCALPEHALHAAAAIRALPGAKASACSGCALDPWCSGGPVDASPEMLAMMVPPPFASALAAGIVKVRGGEAS